MTITIPTEELDESVKVAVDAAISKILNEARIRWAVSEACKEWVQENRETLVPMAIEALKKSITARVVTDKVYKAFMQKIKEDDFE